MEKTFCNPININYQYQAPMRSREATVYCLTKGITYHVTVDAYNESGVARGTQAMHI